MVLRLPQFLTLFLSWFLTSLNQTCNVEIRAENVAIDSLQLACNKKPCTVVQIGMLSSADSTTNHLHDQRTTVCYFKGAHCMNRWCQTCNFSKNGSWLMFSVRATAQDCYTSTCFRKMTEHNPSDIRNHFCNTSTTLETWLPCSMMDQLPSSYCFASVACHFFKSMDVLNHRGFPKIVCNQGADLASVSEWEHHCKTKTVLMHPVL